MLFDSIRSWICIGFFSLSLSLSLSHTHQCDFFEIFIESIFFFWILFDSVRCWLCIGFFDDCSLMISLLLLDLMLCVCLCVCVWWWYWHIYIGILKFLESIFVLGAWEERGDIVVVVIDIDSIR